MSEMSEITKCPCFPVNRFLSDTRIPKQDVSYRVFTIQPLFDAAAAGNVYKLKGLLKYLQHTSKHLTDWDLRGEQRHLSHKISQRPYIYWENLSFPKKYSINPRLFRRHHWNNDRDMLFLRSYQWENCSPEGPLEPQEWAKWHHWVASGHRRGNWRSVCFGQCSIHRQLLQRWPWLSLVT